MPTAVMKVSIDKVVEMIKRCGNIATGPPESLEGFFFKGEPPGVEGVKKAVDHLSFSISFAQAISSLSVSINVIIATPNRYPSLL